MVKGQLIGERTVRVSPALPRDQQSMTPVIPAPAPLWTPSYPPPNTYNYGNYYPTNYGYYTPEYSGYTANYGYAPYYNGHVPELTVTGSSNGDEAENNASPDLVSESRDCQPFSIAQDNAHYVTAQLHVIRGYYSRPRVTMN